MYGELCGWSGGWGGGWRLAETSSLVLIPVVRFPSNSFRLSLSWGQVLHLFFLAGSQLTDEETELRAASFTFSICQATGGLFTWMFPLPQVAAHLALSSPPALRASQTPTCSVSPAQNPCVCLCIAHSQLAQISSPKVCAMAPSRPWLFTPSSTQPIRALHCLQCALRNSVSFEFLHIHLGGWDYSPIVQKRKLRPREAQRDFYISWPRSSSPKSGALLSLIQAQVFGQPQPGEGKGPGYVGVGMLTPITYWGVTQRSNSLSETIF